MAGESAREQARRQREKAARLVESADRWERGANGEVAVAAALAELETSGWTLLHDIAWPGRRYANIDHVAIGEGRAFVIDAKNWTGDVVATGGVLRQNGRSRAKEVAAVAEAASAIVGLVPGLNPTAVRPVLCLVREDWISERFGEVLVCSSHNLVAQLRGQPIASEPLASEQVTQLTQRLVTHGEVGRRQDRPRRTTQAREKPTGRPGVKAGLAKLTVAVVAIAVLLAQPVWFSTALERASQEFAAVFAPTTQGPVPVEKAPLKKSRHRKQGKPQRNN